MKSNKMLMKQNNAGFTLVNVLIVIAVIAILSVGAYPVFSTLIEKSWGGGGHFRRALGIRPRFRGGADGE